MKNHTFVKIHCLTPSTSFVRSTYLALCFVAASSGGLIQASFSQDSQSKAPAVSSLSAGKKPKPMPVSLAAVLAGTVPAESYIATVGVFGESKAGQFTSKEALYLDRTSHDADVVLNAIQLLGSTEPQLVGKVCVVFGTLKIRKTVTHLEFRYWIDVETMGETKAAKR